MWFHPAHITVTTNSKETGTSILFGNLNMTQRAASAPSTFLTPGTALAPQHRSTELQCTGQVGPPACSNRTWHRPATPGQRFQEHHSVGYRVQELTPHVSGRRRRVPELVATLCKRKTRLESSASTHSVLLSLQKNEANWLSLVNEA